MIYLQRNHILLYQDKKTSQVYSISLNDPKMREKGITRVNQDPMNRYEMRIPGKTLKADPGQRILYVRSAYARVTAFTEIRHNGFKSAVEIILSQKLILLEICPLEENMVALVFKSGLVELHALQGTRFRQLGALDLFKMSENREIVSSACVSKNSEFLMVACHRDETEFKVSRLVLLKLQNHRKIEIYAIKTFPKTVNFISFFKSGSLFLDLNDTPLYATFQGKGINSIRIYKFGEHSGKLLYGLNSFDSQAESPQIYEINHFLSIDTKIFKCNQILGFGGKLWMIDKNGKMMTLGLNLGELRRVEEAGEMEFLVGEPDGSQRGRNESEKGFGGGKSKGSDKGASGAGEGAKRSVRRLEESSLEFKADFVENLDQGKKVEEKCKFYSKLSYFSEFY